jgi:GTP-binding protein
MENVLPTVSIIGRANVGKSSLFNALYGDRVAIVDSTPGVTRDRITCEVQMGDRLIELVDTGGVGMESAEEIVEDVDMQIQIAISRSDLILLVVDALEGIHPLDKMIAKRLRKADTPVLIVANKSENPRSETNAMEFYELGFDEPIPVSAIHRKGMERLREEIRFAMPEEVKGGERAEAVKLAIVGRRNAGKSTLVNYLSQEQRVVVSELPGTTRDSVDVRFQVDMGDRKADFIAIDTAGVRKRKQLSESVDFYSQVRTVKAIERAEVVIHMIDATRDITRVDRQLAGMIKDRYKPVIFALNKMDLVADRVSDDEYIDYLWWELPAFRFAPLSFISAATGENVIPTLEIASELYQQAGTRVRTSALNDAIEEITDSRPPKSQSGRPAKILYATQIEVYPPTIALFVNNAAWITDNYERYLIGALRERFAFSHVPLKIVVRRPD